ncbi:sigma-70 family RNA polymerase sigma factor [Brevibacillus porteri]|uniref:sigma-70 family RNA polymerase sigma factor n=1 Tax=Brevibacillus porteri TaxID=2126350 RepID=UPI00370A1BD8
MGANQDEASFWRVKPFLADIQKHCLSLTKNDWDAQDLLQETLTKVYRSLQKAPDRELTKAFLRRIATNAWIDHCRQGKANEHPTLFDEAIYLHPSTVSDAFVQREVFEQLADRLNARQMVLILMMDIFSFTAQETATLLHTTVGAVKEGVKRARQRLFVLAERSRQDESPSSKKKIDKAGRRDTLGFVSKEGFEQFLAAFRAGDAYAICQTYLRLAEQGVRVEKVSVAGDRLFFAVRDPDGHLLNFFQKC